MKKSFLKSFQYAFLSFVMVFLYGCGAAHIQPSGNQTDLNNYDSINVGTVKVYSEEEAAKDNVKLQAKMTKWKGDVRQSLVDYINDSRFNLNGNKPLIANVDVNVAYGNKALRYWVGFGAGKGGVISKFSLIDPATNKVEYTVTAKSDLAMGVFGGDIAQVLKSNIKKLLTQVKKDTEKSYK